MTRVRKRWFRWGRASFFIILYGALLTFALSVNKAEEEAIESVEVDYRSHGGTYHVEVPEAMAHVVIYPGALVEPEAYLPLAEKIADHGFNVHIPRMPFHFSILDANAAEKLDLDDGLPVFIGGHSLGGVAASSHVEENPGKYSGLFLLASYPQRGVDLSGWDQPVLSLKASNDDIIDLIAYEETAEQLPDHTVFHEIHGANHANFGSYGNQRHDGMAGISEETQQTITAEKIVAMMMENLE